MAAFDEAKLAQLQRDIGYSFLHAGHLRHALTHSTRNKDKNNQRLAHLGDAVLELAVREALFSPNNLSKGDLSKQADLVVNNDALAACASGRLHLEEILQESGLEHRDGKTPMSEAFEALVGAIYLDGGAHAFKVVQNLLRVEIDEARNKSPKAGPHD